MPDFNVKYRPQKISELDLVSVREGLTKVLQSGKIPHAFLFCGPRGTGKTSAARIIAKAVNCLKRKENKEIEPCNQCEQCLSITSGNNLDVLEIDAASNRGIDDIRELREKIKLAPSMAEYKVYIIDEAHMLTLEAFNALLKTLEEPPKHAIFILCTTASEKLPETIISRCMRFNFRRAGIVEIVEKLEKIAKEEKMEVDKEALTKIAQNVSGSFRDAQKILEQASFAGQKISSETIAEVLGQTIAMIPQKLIGFLVKKDVKGGLLEVAQVMETGANLRVYTEELIELLRSGLLAKIGISELGNDSLEGVENFWTGLSTSEIRKLINLFSQAALELRDAVIPQLPLELAVVEWCDDQTKNFEEVPEVVENIDSDKTPTGVTTPVSFEEIKNRWPEVLLAVKPRNHSIEALLRATRPIEVKDGFLFLEAFYQFHKDQLEVERNRRIVEQTVLEVFGCPLGLKCALGQKPIKVDKVQEPQEVVVGDESDLVKVAEEIFSGTVN